MPSIKDIKVKTTTKFNKQPFRPWNTSAKDISIEKDEIQLIDKPITTSITYDTDELNKLWRFLSNSKQIVLKYLTEISTEEDNSLILTDTIIIAEVANNLSLPLNTLKTSLQDLKKEKFIFNYETKPGRGGFTRYTIRKDLYKYLKEKFFK